jgi:hypothetical protein
MATVHTVQPPGTVLPAHATTSLKKSKEGKHWSLIPALINDNETKESRHSSQSGSEDVLDVSLVHGEYRTVCKLVATCRHALQTFGGHHTSYLPSPGGVARLVERVLSRSTRRASCLNCFLLSSDHRLLR